MNNSEIDTEINNIINCRTYNTGYPIEITAWEFGKPSYVLQQPIGVKMDITRSYSSYRGGIEYSNNMINQRKLLAVNNVTNSATSPTMTFSELDPKFEKTWDDETKTWNYTIDYRNDFYVKRITPTDTPRQHSPTTLKMI